MIVFNRTSKYYVREIADLNQLIYIRIKQASIYFFLKKKPKKTAFLTAYESTLRLGPKLSPFDINKQVKISIRLAFDQQEKNHVKMSMPEIT